MQKLYVNDRRISNNLFEQIIQTNPNFDKFWFSLEEQYLIKIGNVDKKLVRPSYLSGYGTVNGCA